MASLIARIAALKAAHPDHNAAHPLRLRLNDSEAIELARQLQPRAEDEDGEAAPAPEVEEAFAGVELPDVGTTHDGKPKPTLHEAADALEEFSEKPAPDASKASHADLREWVEAKTKVRADLWEHLEGLEVDGVQLIEER